MRPQRLATISFNASAREMQPFNNSIRPLVSKIIHSGRFLNGGEVAGLEKSLSDRFGRFCVAVASGHDALLFALQALRLSATDEVIFPVNAYPTAFPVFLCGAKPVMCDVDENGQLDPTAVKKLVNSRTRVIIVVHLYGLVGKLDEILEIARKNKITVIEDCAQAFGTTFKGKQVGTFGEIACFSFYPTKNIGTIGDGGAVITKNKKIHSFIRKARQYGEEEQYRSEFVSGHSRLPEFQAGVIHILLKNYDKTMKRRSLIYKKYLKEFSRADLNSKIRILTSDKSSSPSVHLFVIEASKRNQLRSYLRSQGIETLIHYPYPAHKVNAFKSRKKYIFPIAEKLSKNIVSLPFHQFLTDKQIKKVVSTMGFFYEKTK